MLRARNVVAQCLESVLRVVKASLLFSGRSEMLNVSRSGACSHTWPSAVLRAS